MLCRQKTFFDEPVQNYIRAHDNIQKRTTAQVDD